MKKILLFLALPALLACEWVINPLATSYYGAGEYFFISETDMTVGYRYFNQPCVASQTVSSTTIVTIDTPPLSTMLEAMSIKSGKSGTMHAVYEFWGGSGAELRYANRTGGTWVSEVIDTGVNDIRTLDMFIDNNDVPHIVYCDNSKVYYRNRVGGTWSAAEEAASTYADYNFIMVGNTGAVYLIHGNSSMYYSAKIGVGWSSPIVVASNVNYTFSYTFTPLWGAGNGTVFACAYQTAATEDLRCLVFNGSTWVDHLVDAGEEKVGEFISTTVNTAGQITVAYSDFSFDNIKVARFNGTTWNVETVDTPGALGENVSVCTGSNGNPHIIYEDNTNSNLKYAYWVGTTTTTTSTVPPKVKLYSNVFKPLSGEKVSIECELYQENLLSVRLYSPKGIPIATVFEGTKPEGKYTFQWAASNSAGQTVASGLYILVVQANSSRITNKVVVVK